MGTGTKDGLTTNLTSSYLTSVSRKTLISQKRAEETLGMEIGSVSVANQISYLRCKCITQIYFTFFDTFD